MDEQVLKYIQTLEDRVSELEQTVESLNEEIHVLRNECFADTPILGANIDIDALSKHKVQQPSELHSKI